MSLEKLTKTFPWARYSTRLITKMETLDHAGALKKKRGHKLAQASAGSLAEGNAVTLYWLVNANDGKITDAKFQAFGHSTLIGAAQIACDLAIGKDTYQVQRITTDLIDKQVRDNPNDPAFPEETLSYLSLVIEAIEETAKTCPDLPKAASYTAPPTPTEKTPSTPTQYPGWESLPPNEKRTVIEEIIGRDIRPYIVLDGGDVEVVDVINNHEVIITYHGACASCFSSIGSTLSFIQHTLQTEIHPSLTVTPGGQGLRP